MSEFLQHLPSVILAVSFAIVALFVTMTGWAIVGVARCRRALGQIAETVKAIPPADPDDGLPADWYQAMVEAMKPYSRAGWWRAIKATVVEYDDVVTKGGSARTVTGAIDQPPSSRNFVTVPIEQTAPLERIIGTPSWLRFYKLLPGVTTSIGLFGTFLALLLGLQGVRVTGATVTGTDLLINNLSGKFFTSVGAIAVGIVALVIEGILQRAILVRWHEATWALADRLPMLTPSRLIVDLRKLSTQQTTHLSGISSDFALELGNLFREQIGPSMAQQVSISMATELQNGLTPLMAELSGTLNNLTATVSKLESSKQESVVGEIRDLTGTITTSLQATLSDMGNRFQEALTASTGAQFNSLGDTLGNSATVLRDMTASFASVEQGLKDVVTLTRESTERQIQSGSEYAVQMHGMIEGLLARLDQAATSNVTSIGAALSAAVLDLSAKVTHLSDELTASVQASTRETAAASSHALSQASQWTEQTSRQLEQVLASMNAKAALLDTSADRLAEARKTVEQTIADSTGALRAMSTAAETIRDYSTQLVLLQAKVAAGQEAQQHVANAASRVLQQFESVAGSQNELVVKHSALLGEYKEAMDSLDSNLNKVLTAIGDQLKRYADEVHRNFAGIIQTANTYVPAFADAVRGGTERLSENFEDLADALDTASRRINGTGR